MIIYTDGSCNNNGNYPNTGGYGIIVLDDRQEKVLYAYQHQENNTTNNIQELKAILYVLLHYGNNKDVCTVISDSNYAINCYNTWMFKWANNNWLKSDKQPILNKELIETYYTYYQKGYRINLEWVKGHSINKWNNLVDRLAKNKINVQEVMKKYG